MCNFFFIQSPRQQISVPSIGFRVVVNLCRIERSMPRLTRAQKDARKAKADALKALETSSTGNNNNGPPALNCAPCGTSSGIVSAGGEMRVLTAGESQQENVSAGGEMRVLTAGQSQQENVSAGGEMRVLTAGESHQENATQNNASATVQDNRAEKGTVQIGKERSDGGERGPGVNKHQKVNEINVFTVVQDKRAEKSRSEIAKERSGGGERGPSRRSGEEEAVSLRPSQLESRQKHRDDRSSFAGNKGFRQDFNGRNPSASQNYEGFNSRQGGQHGYYENRWGGRGGHNEDDSRRINGLGRTLSRILRHQAPELGLKVRSDGYVAVNELLTLRSKTQAGLPLNCYVVDDLKEAVKRDDKQRFGLHEENGLLLIRANQGHSLQTIKSEDLLKPILLAEEVPVCIHGTYKKYLGSIEKEGLKRMTRNHVHFATGQFKEDGVISGMRGNCEVLIHLNVSKCLKDGMKLYRSENGVILAEGFDGVVPPEYFASIEFVGKKRNNNK